MKTLKKIVAFLILNSAFLLSSHAQIVYTDINPDSTITTGTIDAVKTYNLDLNNDGTMDFKIQAIRGHHLYVGLTLQVIVTPLTTNEVLDSITNDNYANFYPRALALNSYIGDKLVWHAAPTQLLKFRYYGLWPFNTDAYLGLKLIAGSDLLYGWVQLSIQQNGSAIGFTVKDYACNSIPNQPILAGETNCTTPSINLTHSGPLSFCTGDSVTFTANGTGYQYQWKKDGVNISGAKSQTYVAKTAGIYKCKVINSCGSKTSAGKTVTVPCRDGDASFMSMTSTELEHISVYPNPATNSVTIKVPSDNDENNEPAEVQIINLYGEILLQKRIITEQTQIDVSKFSPGMYVVKWCSGENNESDSFRMKKFSVQK